MTRDEVEARSAMITAAHILAQGPEGAAMNAMAEDEPELAAIVLELRADRDHWKAKCEEAERRLAEFDDEQIIEIDENGIVNAKGRTLRNLREDPR